MQTEIEAKFLNIDHEELRAKLKSIGAKLVHPNRLMKRKNYDFVDERLEKEFTGWVRVRDEGDKITLSYKQLDDRGLHGTKEVNVTVDNFDKTCDLLERIGLVVQSYQETKRESWKLGSVEIELDEWPWAKPFFELEAPSEEELIEVAHKLGYDMKDAVHGSVEVVYQAEYNVTDHEIDHCPEYTFTDVPEWLESKRK